jgi:nitrogen regulatory protein PII
MIPIKRVEIVADALELQNIVRELERVGVSGWTVVRNVTGSGERGLRRGDDLTDVFANRLVIVACEQEKLDALVDAIRPILARFGGVCLVSDAMWLKH